MAGGPKRCSPHTDFVALAKYLKNKYSNHCPAFVSGRILLIKTDFHFSWEKKKRRIWQRELLFSLAEMPGPSVLSPAHYCSAWGHQSPRPLSPIHIPATLADGEGNKSCLLLWPPIADAVMNGYTFS